MRVLQICNKSPYPPKEGGPIAMNAITQALFYTGCDVKVIAADTPKYPVNIEQIPEDYLSKTSYESCFIDTKIRMLPALKCFLTSKSYHIERFTSEKFSNFLTKVLNSNKFDVIQFETIYMTKYLQLIKKLAPEAIVVIRTHNVEHKIWERYACSTKNFIKKYYLNHLARTLKKYEIEVLKNVDGIAAISPIDAKLLSNYTNTPIKVIPFNLNSEFLNTNPYDFEERKKTLFFIGSMDWLPNMEGVKWFLNNVWNRIIKQHNNLHLEIAGRNMPEWIYKYNSDNIFIRGKVDDACQYMNSFQIMIVPLLSGSGIRIKIIEGMAAGNVIITTSIGAEGIECEHKKNILIADTPSEFVESVFWCLANPEAMKTISSNARKFAVENYSLTAVAKNLIDFYNELISNKNNGYIVKNNYKNQ